MRWLWTVVFASGCSLIVPGNDGLTPDRVDASQQVDSGRDSGPVPGIDAGVDGGVDAGPIPAAPVLRSPCNGFRTGSALTGALPGPRNALRPAFRWETVEGALTYEVQLSMMCEAGARQDCAFEEALSATTPESLWRPEAALTVSSIQPVGARYFWRVRACAGTCGPWSEVRYLDVGRSPLDFNGDGYADPVVGARSMDVGGVEAGAAFVYAGSADGTGGVPVRELENEMPVYSFFGQVSASAGDLNGDGYDDLVISSYLNDHVYVYYGSSSGIPPTASLVMTNPLDRYSAFGWVVAPAGDINGDGFADLAIGGQSADDREEDEGIAFVFYGAEAGLSTSPTPIANPDPQAGAQFGFSLGGSADLDGDGYTDLVIGATSHDGEEPNQGRVYVFSGGPAGVRTEPSVTLDNPLPSEGSEFGRTLATGDATGDGLGDVLVGAPYASDGAAQVGRGYFFAGGRDGLGEPVELTRSGSTAMGWFGWSVAFVGDVDGDGLGDFVVGMPGQSAPSDREGVVTLYLGNADPPLLASSGRLFPHPSPQVGARFGISVGHGADVNGDGFNEIVVGAAEHSNPELGEGNAFVLRGAPTGIGGVFEPVLDNPRDEAGALFGLIARGW